MHMHMACGMAPFPAGDICLPLFQAVPLAATVGHHGGQHGVHLVGYCCTEGGRLQEVVQPSPNRHAVRQPKELPPSGRGQLKLVTCQTILVRGSVLN